MFYERMNLKEEKMQAIRLWPQSLFSDIYLACTSTAWKILASNFCFSYSKFHIYLLFATHVIRVWSKMQHFISHSLQQRRLDCIRTARAGWTTFVVALIMTVLQLSVKTRWIFCSIISPTERMKDVHHFEKSWWEVFAIYP